MISAPTRAGARSAAAEIADGAAGGVADEVADGNFHRFLLQNHPPAGQSAQLTREE